MQNGIAKAAAEAALLWMFSKEIIQAKLVGLNIGSSTRHSEVVVEMQPSLLVQNATLVQYTV